MAETSNRINMIVTSEILPCKPLWPFIKCYTYREFNTQGHTLSRPWHASLEPYIVFFLKAVPGKLTDPLTGAIVKTGKSCGVVGISSQYNGQMTFNGEYAFFQIIFQPNGFFRLFNIPCPRITDKILWSEEIFDADINDLHEQVAAATGILKMGELANRWLLKVAGRCNTPKRQDKIAGCVRLMQDKAGLVNTGYLAAYANMSVRSFERHFVNEVGISPKLFNGITRFNSALQMKLRYPDLNWTSIAHRLSYFDQNHLIKDFRKFAGEAPACLLKNSALLKEYRTPGS